jgi:hypothetical protein
MSNTASGRLAWASSVLAVVLSLVNFRSPHPVFAAQTRLAKTANNTSGEQFFIISSVDMAKKELLLKEPTEITEVVQVNDQTHCVDSTGKPIQLTALRAGDTVYIRTARTQAGKVATSIRKGPMTVEELHKRYVK